MKKISLTIFLIFLFSVNNLALTKAATTDLGKILNTDLGKILKIQTAVKGKKLNKFFSDNTLLLSFEKKKKEYRFQQKKYEVFEDGKLIESGKWKVSGLLKNQIKLIPESKSKPYYLKKINKKPIIYHYNKSPGTENAIKTLVEIESSSKFTEVSSSTESTEINTASSSITSSESKDKDTKATKKEKKGKKFRNEVTKEELKTYRATSMITYYFFEASHNFMSSLELLYRAYDQNTEADKLKAQIEYNRESKFTESQKLKSTKSIIDKSSVQINAKLTDTSLILSDLGRGYYEQSLPYAFSATENAYNLFITVKNTKERVSASGDLFTGLIDNLSEVVGLATILPEIPTFSRNMIETSKLIFSGAKTKKIRDKGNLNKALEELNLSDM